MKIKSFSEFLNESAVNELSSDLLGRASRKAKDLGRNSQSRRFAQAAADALKKELLNYAKENKEELDQIVGDTNMPYSNFANADEEFNEVFEFFAGAFELGGIKLQIGDKEFILLTDTQVLEKFAEAFFYHIDDLPYVVRKFCKNNVLSSPFKSKIDMEQYIKNNADDSCTIYKDFDDFRSDYCKYCIENNLGFEVSVELYDVKNKTTISTR